MVVSISTLMPLAVVVMSVMLLVPMDPAIIVGDFVPEPYESDIQKPANTDAYSVQDYYFESQGDTCHAWLFLPTKSEKDDEDEEETTTVLPPIIVMATGLGAQKDFGPQRYADAFVRQGMAVFLFDYRNFGASSGKPRNWVSPTRHVQDWHAALDYVTANMTSVVDVTQIGLWGTSFAGGHVLVVTASQQHSVKAVVSQVPHLSGKLASKLSMKRRGIMGTLRMGIAAFQDVARSLVGLSPVCFKICGTGLGKEGIVSILEVSEQEYEIYMSKQPQRNLGGFLNQAPARIALELRFYNPMEVVASVDTPLETPVLLIGAGQDALCPPELIQQVADHLPNSRVILQEDIGHFEIYRSPNWDTLSQQMIMFYQQQFVMEATADE